MDGYTRTDGVATGLSHRSSEAAYTRQSNAVALIRKGAQRSSSAADNRVDHKLHEAVTLCLTTVTQSSALVSWPLRLRPVMSREKQAYYRRFAGHQELPWRDVPMSANQQRGTLAAPRPEHPDVRGYLAPALFDQAGGPTIAAADIISRRQLHEMKETGLGILGIPWRRHARSLTSSGLVRQRPISLNAHSRMDVLKSCRIDSVMSSASSFAASM
ncbi:MAG: hypothetical protein JWP25_8032 [Bradyrhizobium sp.]|jgi:hypothetical protein|nr:hypothetical protein [Bradyrhizobium sp.]